MSWLDTVQLRDLDAGDRLELTCRRCGKVRFVTAGELLARGDFGRLWLSEVEARAVSATLLWRGDAPRHATKRGDERLCRGDRLDCDRIGHRGKRRRRAARWLPFSPNLPFLGSAEWHIRSVTGVDAHVTSPIGNTCAHVARQQTHGINRPEPTSQSA